MNAIDEPGGRAREISIMVDTGTEDATRLSLFESWLSLWCIRNCTGVWSVTQNPDRTKDYQIVLKFNDPREAVHFKLASGSLHVTERKPVSYFLH